MAIISCAEGKIGLQSRKCDVNGIWEAPDMSQCITKVQSCPAVFDDDCSSSSNSTVFCVGRNSTSMLFSFLELDVDVFWFQNVIIMIVIMHAYWNLIVLFQVNFDGTHECNFENESTKEVDQYPTILETPRSAGPLPW